MISTRPPNSAPLWWDGQVTAARPALGSDLTVDVVVVGAGLTGLWTAYELAGEGLSVAVLERDHVGFGASGRNGGWCYDGFAAGMERIEEMSDLSTARAFGAALREMVGVVAEVVAAERIECDFHMGGSVEFLRNGGQVARAEQVVDSARRYGWAEEDLRILSVPEALEIARAADVEGGLWSRHTAALHPVKLVQGLAAAVERMGARIFESTPVSGLEPRRVITAGGHTVEAGAVVLATEGYTASLSGRHRRLAPLYSLMIATEPLPDALWDEIGLSDRQTFGDLRHLVIYGQRTADGRIAFGGRGAPYDYGSRIRDNAEFPEQAFAPLRRTLVEVFPQLAEVGITHQWGGVLGVSRKWMPSVGFDPGIGLAWAGGYVGSGVAATNLAGRTLAALLTGRDDPLTRFPWVNLAVRNWEVEPFRWLGINAALAVMRSADAVEDRTDRPARRAEILWKIVE